MALQRAQLPRDFFAAGKPRVAFACILFLSLVSQSAAQVVTHIQPSDVAFNDFFGHAVTVYGNQVATASDNITSERNGLGGIAYTYQGIQGIGADGRTPTGPLQWSQTASFSGSHSGQSSVFSYGGIELFGDDLIVGAPFSNQNGNGAAYIYERNLGGANAWGERAYLQDLTTKTNDGDGFASAVAIDANFAIVGAPNNDDAGTGAGKLFIFAKNSGGANKWGQISEMGAIDPRPSAGFGSAVAISGSLAIVGADHDSTFAANGGAVYLYQLNLGGSPTQLAKLTPPNPATISEFGRHVDIYGHTAIVSGLDRANNANVLSVYDQSALQPLVWNLTATLELPGTDAISLYNDTLAVGATGYQIPGQRPGAVLLFQRNASQPSTWSQTRILTVSDPDLFDAPIGDSVAIYDKIVVAGSPQADFDYGEAYIFELPEPPTADLAMVAILLTSILSHSRRWFQRCS